MAKIAFISADGTRTELDVASGQSLMYAAVTNQVGGVLGECGGSLACATCHIHVDPAWACRLGPVSAAEDEMLEATASERTATSRLACQIVVTDALDGLVVTLPELQV